MDTGFGIQNVKKPHRKQHEKNDQSLI